MREQLTPVLTAAAALLVALAVVVLVVLACGMFFLSC
jgi:hypothetical protein